MQALTLPAGHGWRWLSDGFAIFLRKRLVLSFLVLGYFMVMALIGAVPVIGRIVAMLLIPVFSVSLMNACRLLEQGNPLLPPLLFSCFRKNLRPLLVLGVIYIIASLVIFGIVAMIDDGVLLQLVFLGRQPDEQVLASEEVRLAGQLALALFVPLMIAYWYAPMLVAWNDLPAAKSLFFSFVACVRNWRAFLVYCAAIVAFGAFLPGLLVGVLISLIPSSGGLFISVLTLLIVLFVVPTLYASFYVSYRDVFVSIDEDA